MISSSIPDLDALLNAVMAASTNKDSFLHGPGHWRCVAWTGLSLAPQIPQADPTLVFLFGLIHDSKRLNDGADPHHGVRAAALAEQLNGTVFHLSVSRLALLHRACAEHTHGRTTDDPTIGLCWDADRLNLWRVGVRPDPKFLSHAESRSKDVIRHASLLEAMHFAWKKIFSLCSDG